MPYLGKSPQHGNYSKLDDFSGDFDGSDATHAIASNGIAITPVRPEALIISINGVIQEPVTDYTVSGTNITFTTAPTAGDNFFGVAMGEQLQIGTPSDATITSAKLSGNLTTPGTLTVTNSALISGTTPTLTIGDAGAEDAKIVFDGNAQDFHIGLDDTADSLAIGLGSALGTTDHMVFDATGAITTPLNPAFKATGGSVSNVTGDGTLYQMIFGTDIFDANGDHADGVFTAPVAGNYFFHATCFLLGMTSSETLVYMDFVTSDGGTDDVRVQYHNPAPIIVGAYYDMSGSCSTYLDAGDTMVVKVAVGNGSKVVDIDGGYNMSFGGFLTG